MDSRMKQELDRWITGNYGNDQYRDDVPEEAYHASCEGEGCEGCNNTGIDPEAMAAYRAQADAEAKAEAEAYAESLRDAAEIEQIINDFDQYIIDEEEPTNGKA